MKFSITVRLVAMFALATQVMLLLIGVTLYGVLERELARHQRDELQTAYQDMEYMIKRAGTPARWSHVVTKMNTLSAAHDGKRFWVASTDPQFRYGEDLAAVRDRLGGRDGMGALKLPGLGTPLYTLTRTIPGFQLQPDIHLTIGIDAQPYLHTLHTFVSALIALSLATVVLVMLLGYWIARVGLRPLEQLSREARQLSPRTLSQRLHVSSLPAELSDLASAFNGALGRLEAAYTQLEAFNADVAHELRTPLTNLIGETQVALSRERTAQEFLEVMQSNLEEIERLRSIVNDMLFLARADQGEAATGLVRAPVVREIDKTIEFLEFVLEETQETVTLEGDTRAEAMIETSLFRRALANLLQNAIEHSQSGAVIRVSIARHMNQIRISVTNPGTPIPPQHLPLLFDRFYRVDAARYNGKTHGHGLGLAIVRAIATMHGGDVFASSADGITTIGFSVPAADSPPEAPSEARLPRPAGRMGPSGHMV